MNRCRGTLRMRSNTRGSAMPCSCSRCTQRARARAQVMPIPLKRGPSMKLLKLEPALELVQSRVARQIDLQRRDGRETVGNRMKIGARPGILAGAGGSHPIHVAASRVLGGDDRHGAMAAGEARYLRGAHVAGGS